MLRFSNKPDDIFVAMLSDAMTETLEVFLDGEHDEGEQKDAFQCHMPRSSTLFKIVL
jgi:hypothetical protein